jgi:hypothetical protein
MVGQLQEALDTNREVAPKPGREDRVGRRPERRRAHGCVVYAPEIPRGPDLGRTGITATCEAAGPCPCGVTIPRGSSSSAEFIKSDANQFGSRLVALTEGARMPQGMPPDERH